MASYVLFTTPQSAYTPTDYLSPVHMFATYNVVPFW